MLPNNTKEEAYSVCFNPNCSFPLQRVFKPETANPQHGVVCQKWIIDKANRNIFSSIFKQTPVASLREELNFYTQPLETLASFQSRKEVIRQSLANLYDELKIDLCQFLNYCKNQKLQEFQRLIRESDFIIGIIRNSLQKLQASKITTPNFIQKLAWQISSQFDHLPATEISLGNILLFDKEGVQAQGIGIKKMISKMSDCLVRQKQLEGELETVKLSDMIKAQNFLKNSRSNQVFKVYELCQWAQPDYIIKGSFSSTVKCPLCPFKFELPKSQATNDINTSMKQLSLHLILQHLSFIGYCYGQRINKLKRDQITFEQILYLMQSQAYNELVIIDGAHYPSKLYINFADGPPNPGQCECRWQLVGSFQQAGFYTSLLIYEIVIKLGKCLRTIGFKKHYYQLYKKLIDTKNLQKFKIEEKLKPKKPILQDY